MATSNLYDGIRAEEMAKAFNKNKYWESISFMAPANCLHRAVECSFLLMWRCMLK